MLEDLKRKEKLKMGSAGITCTMPGCKFGACMPTKRSNSGCHYLKVHDISSIEKIEKPHIDRISNAEMVIKRRLESSDNKYLEKRSKDEQELKREDDERKKRSQSQSRPP